MERKRAEQKVRQDEGDLRTISDAIRQSIVVLAPDGTTLYANRVARDLTGLTVVEVNDKGFFVRVFHPDDVDRVREEPRVGLWEGLPFELGMRALFKSGQYRWHSFSTTL
jgi:PAS domain S-box-containing protein